MEVVVDEGGFEALGPARHPVAVGTEPGPPATRAGEGLGDHQVDRNPVRTEPGAGAALGGGPPDETGILAAGRALAHLTGGEA